MSLASLPLIDDSKRAAPAQIDFEALRSALTNAIEGEVRFQRLDRALYSTDASVYQIVPLGIVIPKTRADVLATLQVCACFGVPITARGGGTSQAGQCIGAGVILDFSKYLNQILEVNAAEKWVRVEPGSVLDDLNHHVKPHGLQFAPDISTANRATIGGMIANNSSGTHSLIHGKTIDHVLDLTVLLADGSVVEMRPLDEAALEAKCGQQDFEGNGYRVVRQLAAQYADEIDRRFPKILRRVGGYNLDRFTGGSSSLAPRPLPLINLAHLLVGSEGTLGIVLEAKLRLVELPKAKALLVVQFTDLLEALGATPAILKHQPAAVEVMDRFILDCTKLNPEASRLRDFLEGDPGAILIIEFYGDTAAELPQRLDALEADLRARRFGYHHHRVTDPTAQARVWKLRTLALGLSMADKGDAKAISFVEDTAVSPEHLRDYIAEFLDVVKRHGTQAGVYAHASVGCLHVRPIIDLKTQDGVRRFQAIADEIADLVLKYGGALSGEHGDGLVRSPFQEKMFGPTLYQAFREIKRAFDPQNLLNPGKIVDAPPLASNLRYGSAYVTPDVPTTFDFSADGGLSRAAELCAGVGECRKTRAGTMCPSYQATHDELHSTRGRANTLRMALTGQLDVMASRELQGPESAVTDANVFQAMDLCLECKACKSECPTNVDMARLKAEFLHQYHKKHGLPWRNWLFGNVARLGKWGGRFAPVSNRLARSRFGRWLHEKLLGIDRRRLPPVFASRRDRTALADFLFHAPENLENRSHSVVFFADTFVRRYEPTIGLAACEILNRLGCDLHTDFDLDCRNSIPTPPLDELFPNLRCCGRPFISNGMLDHASACAAANMEWLYPLAAAGAPIVACEPSCILTIKDDYPALLKGEARRQAHTVAAMCFTFEELVEQLFAEARVAGNADHSFRAGPKKILVQGHCHQRSLVGMGATLRLLRRIPGAEVIDIDAGCCGMAGSFGYEKEHYEISRLVGEQRLFPALRRAEADTAIVAPGFSCRLQIEHFTVRKAVHPAMLLQSLLT
jgi:FAD/FMN-containing dehydrogenase/Fe-S oxidoreductase